MSIRILLIALLFVLVSPIATSGTITITGAGMAPSILGIPEAISFDGINNVDDGDGIAEPIGPLFVQVWIDRPDAPAIAPRKVAEEYLGVLDEGYYFRARASSSSPLEIPFFITESHAYRFEMRVAALSDLNAPLATAPMGTLSSALVVPAMTNGPTHITVPDGLASEIAITGTILSWPSGDTVISMGELTNRSANSSGNLVATLLAVTSVTEDFKLTGYVLGRGLVRNGFLSTDPPMVIAGGGSNGSGYATIEFNAPPAGTYPVALIISAESTPDTALDIAFFPDTYTERAVASSDSGGGNVGGLFLVLMTLLGMRRRRQGLQFAGLLLVSFVLSGCVSSWHRVADAQQEDPVARGLVFIHVSNPDFSSGWVTIHSEVWPRVDRQLVHGYGVFSVPAGEYQLSTILAIDGTAAQMRLRTLTLDVPFTVQAEKVSSLGTLITAPGGIAMSNRSTRIFYGFIRNHADALRVIRERNFPIAASLTEVDIIDVAGKYTGLESIPVIRQQLLAREQRGGLSEGEAVLASFSVENHARAEKDAVIASELGALGFVSSDRQPIQMIPMDTLEALRVFPQYGNADSPPQSWFVASALGDVYRVRNMTAERLAAQGNIYPAHIGRLGELLVIADEQGSVAISHDEGAHWNTHPGPASKRRHALKVVEAQGGALLIGPGHQATGRIYYRFRGSLVRPDGTVSDIPWTYRLAAAAAPQYVNGTIAFEKELWFRSRLYVLDATTGQWIKRPMPARGCTLRAANDALLANKCNGKKNYQSTDLGQTWLPVPG